MLTFLPYADFGMCAKSLDSKILGRQRLVAHRILMILNGIEKTQRYENHPCVRLWRGYEEALMKYIDDCNIEWVRRGFNNYMGMHNLHKPVVMPHWCGDEELHTTHRAKLMLKNPTWYEKFNWNVQPDKKSYWPDEKQKAAVVQA